MGSNITILTIAIPSYNRVDQIQKQVRLLLPQLNSEVKLIVLDNCSPVTIKSLFSKVELDSFTIIRNKMNIGADANIARCFEICETKWLWTLGDDDFVKHDAVNNVLENIRKYKNATWLNFAASENSISRGFKGFSDSLNSIVSFSNSFWMSKCVYNLHDLSDFIYWYYKNVSSMIGTLIMLLKYTSSRVDSQFVRLKIELFEFNSSDISWSHSDYICYAGIMFDSFCGEDRLILKKNALKILTRIHLCMIRYDMVDRKYLFRIVIARYGLLNSLISFPLVLFRSLFMIMFPVFVIEKIIKVKRLFEKKD